MKQLFLCFVFLLPMYLNGQPQTANPDMAVANLPVRAVAVDGNYTYIGGDFTYVGPNTGNGVKVSTTSQIPDGSFPKVNGYIRAAVPDGSGGWYIGGSFSRV